MTKIFRAVLVASLFLLGLSACGGSTMTSNLAINSISLDGKAVDINKTINVTGASVLNVQTSRAANFATSAINAAGARLFDSNISYTVLANSSASNWSATFNKNSNGTVSTATGTIFSVQITDPTYGATVASLQIKYSAP